MATFTPRHFCLQKKGRNTSELEGRWWIWPFSTIPMHVSKFKLIKSAQVNSYNSCNPACSSPGTAPQDANSTHCALCHSSVRKIPSPIRGRETQNYTLKCCRCIQNWGQCSHDQSYSCVHVLPKLDRVFDRSIIALLLGLFRTDLLAREMSAVTRVIDILWARTQHKTNPQSLLLSCATHDLQPHFIPKCKSNKTPLIALENS